MKSIDTVHYVYYEPMIEGDTVDGDYYGLVGFRRGRGIWSELVPAGKLTHHVGPVVANNIALGAGSIVRQENVVGEERPWRSLPVHPNPFRKSGR